MTTARLVRASAARAKLVKRWWQSALLSLVVQIGVMAMNPLCASSVDGPALSLPDEAGGKFQLRLEIRAEPAPFLTLQGRSRGFRLREFVEPTLPQSETVRLTDDESREGWDWAGIRRQLVRALAGARKIRFERDLICVESDRFNEPGRIPGVVQDAAIAAGVRARLAGEPTLRGSPLEVQCREGCIRLRGQCRRCPETSRAILLALSVEGVREVRADLPGDLQREMSANR